VEEIRLPGLISGASEEELMELAAEAREFIRLGVPRHGIDVVSAYSCALLNLTLGPYWSNQEGKSLSMKQRRLLVLQKMYHPERKFEAVYMIPGKSCPWCKNRAKESNGGVWAIGPRTWQVGQSRQRRTVTCSLCHKKVSIGLKGFVQRVKEKKKEAEER